MHSSYVPLAERMRPQNFEEVVGQEHLLKGDGTLLRYMQKGYLPSLLLWGPPGSGKTTIARLLAQSTGAFFVSKSAVFIGVSELRKLFAEAEQRHKDGQQTCLFLDEIHRFSKSQQDALLREVELGGITLIAASTENPSFEVISALLSRLQVFILRPLDEDNLLHIYTRCLTLHANPDLRFTADARDYLIAHAQGDARRLLNSLEQCVALNLAGELGKEDVQKLLSSKLANYDKQGDAHYALISSLHKAVRGSDCDAALFWLARMLLAGEDPLYVARRLLRMAYEDIGLSDPQAAVYALNAWQTYERLGSPEGELALAQVVIYLALAPKSNRGYTAYHEACGYAKKHSDKQPPMHIINAATAKMREWGYGKGYHYDHDTEEGFSGQRYFPDSVETKHFYQPVERGFEREMRRRLQYFQRMRDTMNTRK